MDDDIGWNDFALRNYDPQIGRWVQQDPYQEYATPYVGMGGDPVNMIDPSGGFTLAGLSKAGTAAVMTLGGAIIGTAVGLISGDDDFTGTLIGAGVGLGAGLANLSKDILIKLGISAAAKATGIINGPITSSGAGENINGTNSRGHGIASVDGGGNGAVEPQGIDPIERIRILAAIGLGEGGNGYTFNTNEIVQIAYVYVHKEAEGKPLGDKSSFYASKGLTVLMKISLILGITSLKLITFTLLMSD